MKTKPFLLATAGSTVDGRVIDEKMLEEMAKSYDPKTYGARLNIEHIRGISGEGPFRAYGDVVELSTAQVDVNFNGKTEKRLGLFGVFDVSPDAKKLNDAGQKVYPSIEIEPNFAGKGFAYMMGCALTDSPASIATERLQFNRGLPGNISVAHDDAALLEFPEDAPAAESGGFLNALGGVLDKFAEKIGVKEASTPAAPTPKQEEVAPFDFSHLRPLLEDMGKQFATGLDGLRNEMRGEVDRLGVQIKKIAEEQETTPAPNFRQRPQSNGGAADYAGIF
ncbi:GPO family capsid scaffolding protein [Sphingomonas sp.]|uniref:GPO family capsid scaffolding protein n=1 Tax=Sphingomonas sp. TaxID=28214 RepID=UPI00307DA7DB